MFFPFQENLHYWPKEHASIKDFLASFVWIFFYVLETILSTLFRSCADSEG